MPARTKARRKTSSAKRSTISMSARLNQTNVSSASTSSSHELNLLTTKEYESPQEFLKEVEVYYQKKEEVRKQMYDNVCEQVKKMIRDKLNSLPADFRKMDVNSEVDKNILGDQNTDPNTVSTSLPRQPRPRVRKVGENFEFKKPKTPRPARTSSQRRSVSASALPSSSTDKLFKTPIMTSRKMPLGHTITPRIYNDTPITVMRRPGKGEVAVSLTGSPLMVGAIAQEDIPTVSVPLRDGRVFSIMPEKGAPPADLPEFDEQTKQYLRTLQAHLAILAPRTP